MAVNSVWVYSSILSSKGGASALHSHSALRLHPLLRPPLSFSLSSSFSPAFIPPSASRGKNPIREKLGRPPHPAPPSVSPPSAASFCAFPLLGGASSSLPAAPPSSSQVRAEEFHHGRERSQVQGWEKSDYSTADFPLVYFAGD